MFQSIDYFANDRQTSVCDIPETIRTTRVGFFWHCSCWTVVSRCFHHKPLGAIDLDNGLVGVAPTNLERTWQFLMAWRSSKQVHSVNRPGTPDTFDGGLFSHRLARTFTRT